MKLIKYLLSILACLTFSVEAERFPEFSYDYKELSLHSNMFKDEPIILERPERSQTVKRVHDKLERHEVKTPQKEPLISGEVQSDLRESSSIRGQWPKIIFRDERFVKSRFLGKLYSSKRYFLYLGGFKATSWRADPRDMGVFAGSGMDF